MERHPDGYRRGDVNVDRADSDKLYMYRVKGDPTPIAYLPHSCDEWLIGTVEQVEELIADLHEVKARMLAMEADQG